MNAHANIPSLLRPARMGLAMIILAGVALAGGWQEKKEQPASEKPKEAQPEKKPETKPAEKPKTDKPAEAPKADAAGKYVLGYKMKSIDGKEVDLSTYKGKVLMIVNVASNCGLTPQYTDLQKLYDAKKDRGLVILGFPANNFMGQEPGTDTEIAAFCKSKYQVTFPMFSKISVKGEDAHPLYKQLADKANGAPSWNFTKYLVDRDGNVVQRFDPKTKPDDPALNKKIDELLAAPAKADPPKQG